MDDGTITTDPSMKAEVLNKFLDRRLISTQQHGFIRRRSVCTTLFDCLENWALNLQSRHVTDVIFFDSKKRLTLSAVQQTVGKIKILRNFWKLNYLDLHTAINTHSMG